MEDEEVQFLSKRKRAEVSHLRFSEHLTVTR